MNNKKTLAIAAICFPPCLIGPAILMGNLFRHFPKGSYHVLMGRLDHVWPPIDMDSMRDQFMALSSFSTCPVKLFDEYGKMYDRSP